MSQPGRPILGTYDLEKKVEDTVILLDAKRAFIGDVSRMVLITRGVMEHIVAKASLAPADRFAARALQRPPSRPCRDHRSPRRRRIPPDDSVLLHIEGEPGGEVRQAAGRRRRSRARRVRATRLA